MEGTRRYRSLDRAVKMNKVKRKIKRKRKEKSPKVVDLDEDTILSDAKISCIEIKTDLDSDQETIPDENAAEHINPFGCPYCDRSFKSIFPLRRHARLTHKGCPMPALEKLGEVSQYSCPYCERTFKANFTLRRHVKVSHKGSSLPNRLTMGRRRKERPDIEYKCKVCHVTCPNRQSFEEHKEANPECLANDKIDKRRRHQLNISSKRTLEFDSEFEFLQWKRAEEDSTLTRFVKSRGDTFLKRKSSMSRVYCCHRSGRYVAKGRQIRRIKTKGSCKIGQMCPAKIFARLSNDGSVTVMYYPDHSGHDFEPAHLYPRNDKRCFKKLNNMCKSLLESVQGYPSLIAMVSEQVAKMRVFVQNMKVNLIPEEEKQSSGLDESERTAATSKTPRKRDRKSGTFVPKQTAFEKWVAANPTAADYTTTDSPDEDAETKPEQPIVEQQPSVEPAVKKKVTRKRASKAIEPKKDSYSDGIWTAVNPGTLQTIQIASGPVHSGSASIQASSIPLQTGLVSVNGSAIPMNSGSIAVVQCRSPENLHNGSALLNQQNFSSSIQSSFATPIQSPSLQTAFQSNCIQVLHSNTIPVLQSNSLAAFQSNTVPAHQGNFVSALQSGFVPAFQTSYLPTLANASSLAAPTGQQPQIYHSFDQQSVIFNL